MPGARRDGAHRGFAACRSVSPPQAPAHTRRLNSSFESRRPSVVRRTRSATRSRRPCSNAQGRSGASGPDSASAVVSPSSSRSARITDSAAAPASSTSSEPPGGSDGRAARRGERGEVSVEARRVPASRDAVERVGAGTHRLVRLAGPVRQVVPALVAGAGPVRDLVAAEAGRGEAIDGEPVLVRRPVVVLLRTRPVAPAPGAAGRREVVAGGAGDALGVGVVERQRVGGHVVDAQLDRRVQRGRERVDRLAGHVVQQVDRDRRRSRRREPRGPRRRRATADAAGPAAGAAPDRTTAHPSTAGSRPMWRVSSHRHARPGPGSPRS